MCIVFYTLSQPGFKLVLAANRDEFLDRPATPAAWHNFDQGGSDDWVLCGRDLGSPDKGTWLGITRDLRVGILTNIRYPLVEPPPGPIPSRGHLLKMYLSPRAADAPSLDAYLESIHADAYVGFNLLLLKLHRTAAGWGPTQCGYLSNRSSPNILHPTQPGCHGMSNSLLTEPFAKVTEGEESLASELRQWGDSGEDDDQLVERLMRVLSPAPPVASPEDMAHAIRVQPLRVTENHVGTEGSGRWYGTRVATVILVKDDGQVIFVERDISVLDGDQVKPGSDERRVVFQADVS